MQIISIMAIMLIATPLQKGKNTNKHFSHTLETTASASNIWVIWVDVPNWKEWDTGLKDAVLDEAFKLGSRGKIIDLKGRASKFKVVAYEEGKSYTFKTQLPLAGLYVKRTLEEKDGQTFFTHEVWFKGLTAGMFAKRFGGTFKAMLPGVMGSIKAKAEQK